MAASFVGFIVAASLLMAQHEFTMCLSADDFIVIADTSAEKIFVTNMSTGPDLDSALPLTFTPELTLTDPVRVDFDCVDQKIYLTDKGDERDDDIFIATFNTDGSAAKKVLTAIPVSRQPYGIHVDEANRRFFWTGASYGEDDVTVGGGVFVTDMAGTMTERLTSDETFPILENIALDEKEGVLYYTDSMEGRSGVYTVNTDGSGSKKIVSVPGKDDFTGVAVDDNNLYWSDSSGHCIGIANKDGTNSMTVATEMAYEPEDMVIYYNYLYFVDKEYDALFRMPKNGSAEPVLVSSNDEFDNPRGLHIEFTPPCITDTLDLTVVSANELVLSWTPDNEICYAKCEADEYLVSFQPYDVQTCSVSDSNVNQEPWQSTSLTTLDNLAQDTYYQMKVTSRNLPADGQDPYEGNSVYVVEPCIADDLTVEQKSSNELGVSWSATECECHADEFQVSYTTLDYCNVEATDILPWQTSTSASLSVLSPLSRVDVTVSYRKMYGQTLTEGRLPLTETIRNITSAPTGPPSDVSVSSVGANDLVMAWSDIPCDKSGGAELIEYQYELESRYGTITGSNTSSIAAFSGLNCGTEYSFRVKATTMGGVGPFSEYSEVQTLISEAPTGPPSDVSVSSVGANDLVMTWSDVPCENSGGAELIEYQYELESRYGTITGSNTSSIAAFSGLNCGAEYSFRVKSTTVGGKGPFSEYFEVQTLISEAPTGPPSDVSVSSVGANDLVMTWSDVPCENSGGAELIEYQYELESRYGTITGSNTSSIAAFSGLNCGTEYSFRVKSTTVGGIGPFSEYFEVQTLISEEPFASEISATHVPGGTKISWESSVCPPESFDVEYTLTLRDQCEAVTLFTNRLQVHDSAVTLDNLLPFSTYRVVVTGTGSSGTTDTISTSIVTQESAPSAPPVGLQVVNVETSGLEFSWLPPRCGTRHGVIVMYQYEYRYQTMTRIRTTSSTSVKLEGLSSNTDYEFRVAAITSAGIGPYSNAVLVKTDAIGQCPFDYCLHGGTCDFNESSGAPSCSCTNGYIGNRCDMRLTLPPAETIPAESDDGIGPGAIAAIATSLVIGVVVTSVAVAVFFYLVRRRSDSAQMLGRAGPAANFGFSDINAGNWILQ